MEWTIENIDDKYSVVRTYGKYNSANHYNMVEDLLSKDFWRPGMPIIYDHRELDISESSYDTVNPERGNYSLIQSMKLNSVIAEQPLLLLTIICLAFSVSSRQLSNLMLEEHSEWFLRVMRMPRHGFKRVYKKYHWIFCLLFHSRG